MPKADPIGRYDVVDLKIFRFVYEERSLTRGAARANLAPSSASERIRRLETLFGTALFERMPRGLRATAAGAVFADHARACLARLAQMHMDLAPFAEGTRGTLNVLANHTALTGDLPLAIERFLAGRPGMNVRLKELSSAQVVAGVAQGLGDIGVAAGDLSHPDLVFEDYADERLVAVLPAKHALAERTSVAFAEIARHPFVSLDSGSAMHSFTIEAAGREGLALDIRVQVASYAILARMVGAGVGVGIAPQSAIAQSEGLRIVTLADEWAWRRSRVCRRVDLTPTDGMQALLSCILDPELRGAPDGGDARPARIAPG